MRLRASTHQRRGTRDRAFTRTAKAASTFAAVFVDVVAVADPGAVVRVAGVVDGVDEHSSRPQYAAYLCDRAAWICSLDRAMHSSMWAKTASTESSASGSGSRTSCTVVATASSSTRVAPTVRKTSAALTARGGRLVVVHARMIGVGGLPVLTLRGGQLAGGRGAFVSVRHSLIVTTGLVADSAG